MGKCTYLFDEYATLYAPYFALYFIRLGFRYLHWQNRILKRAILNCAILLFTMELLTYAAFMIIY